MLEAESQALLELGHALLRAGYEFVTVTPETHARVWARARRLGMERARTLRDVFGWSMPFEKGLLPTPMFELLSAAGAVAEARDLFRSSVRFSSLMGRLFVHSAFPTQEADAVFFGPDTYRFCRLLQGWAPSSKRVLDVGCGSGAGGISLAGRSARIVLADINVRALAFARVNAELNSTPVEVIASDVLEGVTGEIDLVIANPPYMRDTAARLYRDGGGALGEGLAVRIVREALPRLSRNGTLILYTGSAIVAGEDTFLRSVTPILEEHGARFSYEELDPDVFGDELEQPAYGDVERIAAVGLQALGM